MKTSGWSKSHANAPVKVTSNARPSPPIAENKAEEVIAEDESLRLQADPDCPLCEGIGTVPYGSMQVPCPECGEKGK